MPTTQESLKLSATAMKKIIADTPFLSNERAVVVIGLPDRLAQLGLSTFEEMWAVSPEKLVEALSVLEVRNGEKSALLRKLDEDGPARLVKLLRAPQGDKESVVRGAERLSSEALRRLLG